MKIIEIKDTFGKHIFCDQQTHKYSIDGVIPENQVSVTELINGKFDQAILANNPHVQNGLMVHASMLPLLSGEATPSSFPAEAQLLAYYTHQQADPNGYCYNQEVPTGVELLVGLDDGSVKTIYLFGTVDCLAMGFADNVLCEFKTSMKQNRNWLRQVLFYREMFKINNALYSKPTKALVIYLEGAIDADLMMPDFDFKTELARLLADHLETVIDVELEDDNLLCIYNKIQHTKKFLSRLEKRRDEEISKVKFIDEKTGEEMSFDKWPPSTYNLNGLYVKRYHTSRIKYDEKIVRTMAPEAIGYTQVVNTRYSVNKSGDIYE